MRWLVVAALLFGCAATPVRHRTPVSIRGDDLIQVHIRGRRPYLRRREHGTLRISVAFYVQRRSFDGHDLFVPIDSYSGDPAREVTWMPLSYTLFTDVTEFVQDGFVSVRARGIGPDDHPLRERCYGDLLEAASADIETGRIHRLHVESIPVPHPRFGCRYRLRP